MPNIVAPMWRIGVPVAATGASNLSAVGHYLGAVFVATPGKTITKIGAYCTGASGSPVVDVRLESLGAASYYPSGNLIATGTELAAQSVAATTWYNFTLGTPYAVPTGATTIVCPVIRYVSGTSVNFNLRNSIFSLGSPRPVQSQGADSTQLATPMICLEYSDGSVHFSIGYTAIATTSYNSASNPDEYGNRFTAPFNCVAVGLQDVSRRNAAAGVSRYRILDSNLNVLTTDTELVTSYYDTVSNSSNETHVYYFSSPVNLIAGRTYYITRAATTTDANTVYTQTITFPSDAHKAAFFDDIALCSRQNDTGAFTIDTTKVEMITPIITNAFSNRVSVG